MMLGTLLATDNENEATGAIVYWALTGVVLYTALETAWANAGLDPKELPSPVTPAVARWRACVAKGSASERTVVQAAETDSGAETRVRVKTRILARPLARKGDCALVREEAWPDRPLHHVTIAELHGLDGGGTEITTDDDDLKEALRFEINKQAGLLSTDDVSVWLTALVTKAKAVAIRPNGGTYFLPKPALDGWRARLAAVRACTKHKGYEIPAMKSSEAVEAILDALAREAEAEAEATENELLEGDLSPRKMNTRARRLEATAIKVMEYEALLSVKATTLTERLDRLRANLSAAILASSAEGA